MQSTDVRAAGMRELEFPLGVSHGRFAGTSPGKGPLQLVGGGGGVGVGESVFLSLRIGTGGGGGHNGFTRR